MIPKAAGNGTASRQLGWAAKLLGMVAIVVACMAPTRAIAWGDKGHRIIARIAAERLTDAARAEAETLLGGPAGDAMADASTWADEIKRERPETRPWHYVNIPITDLSYKPELCPKDNCIVAQIEREIRIISDKSQPQAIRAEALRFLIHFVGDLHQPLHCGDNGDRGGNEVKVRLNGRDTNLHAVWDLDVMQALGTGDEMGLSMVRGPFFPELIRSWTSGSVADWCVESAEVAKRVVYEDFEILNPGPRHELVDGYPIRVSIIGYQQIEKAGVRLAFLLNKAFE